MPKEKTAFIVKVAMPEGMAKMTMEIYLRVAIQMWRKGRDPEDILFNMPDKAFSVMALTRRMTHGITKI